MPRSIDQVGDKTRSAVMESAPVNQSQTPKRRKIPLAYLVTHHCKVCDGKHCTGHCKF